MSRLSQKRTFAACVSLIVLMAFLYPTSVLSATFKWEHGPLGSRIGGHVIAPDESEAYIYKKDFLRAVSTDTGGQLWEMSVPGSNEAVPTVARGGTIIVPSSEIQNGYRAYAPDPDQGLQWVDTAPSRPRATPAIHNRRGIAYLPFVETLKAVDLETGEVLATFSDFDTGIAKTGLPAWGSPVIAPDGTVIFGVGHVDDMGNELVPPEVVAVKYDSSGTGSFDVQWRYQPQKSVRGGFALDPGRDGVPPQVYFQDGNRLYSLDLKDGTERWTYPFDGRAVDGDRAPSPVLGPKGTIYIGDDTETLYALNADSSVKWKTQLGLSNGDRMLGTAAVGDSGPGHVIYLGTDSDNNSTAQFARLVAVSDQGGVLWVKEHPSPSSSDVFEEITYSPALLENGTLVVFSHGLTQTTRANNVLYGFETASDGLAGGPWPRFRRTNQYEAESDTTSTQSSSDETTSSGGGGSCLIERTAPDAWTTSLRDLRDAVLLGSTPGRAITRTYYRWLGSR